LNHPEIKRIGFQVNQLETEYQLAKNNMLPRLDLYLGVFSDFGVNPGTRYLPSTSSLPELKVSVVLEFPIFFRSSRGKLESSNASIYKMETIQKLALNRFEIRMKDSGQAMKAAFERLKLAKEEIKLSKQLEDSEKTRAFHGDSSFLLVNIREQATREAMGKEIEAYSDFYKEKAEYEASIGEIPS
jgi:outer membrane protein TolC